jgi:ubiquinone/menaquinone biosynthesis C-methylase UbiE
LPPPEKKNSEDWNERYEKGDRPWDVGKPEGGLTRFIESGALKLGAKVLELGCGTGTDSIHLAKNGFRVVGIDFSSLAIKEAKKRAQIQHLGDRCRFYLNDVCDLTFLKDEKFDFAFDKTCFDNIDSMKRMDYVRSVRSVLKPKARMLLIATSDLDKNDKAEKLTEKGLRSAFGEQFSIQLIERTTLKHIDHDHPAWKVVLGCSDDQT